MNFSKSKYCAYWQCPKMAWLKQYKPELCELDSSAQARLKTGNEVGDLAMELFGNYTEVTAFKEDGSLDLSAMISKTEELLQKGEENICEASFSYNGLYCAVDILRKEGGGYAIYEVKSSTKLNAVYLADIAYQKYVLQKCGVSVTGAYLVHINADYLFDGAIDLNKLFETEDVSALLREEEAGVEARLKEAEAVMDGEEEPQRGLGLYCAKPYDCGFWKYCTRDLPERNVFDIYRLSFEKKLELYEAGVVSYDDLFKYGKLDNPIRRRQVEYALSEKGVYIEKENIRAFLQTLYYPLYFLDFETMQPVIPQFPRSHPYDQIPFQYSLHYIEREGGELKHKEFLGVSGEDPRRALAQRLVDDVPRNACVLAYNKAFECTRIKELSELFPDLANALTDIRLHIVDLLVPFQKGYYYNRAMGGSFSIKSVLPALFPDDPALNYHNLEGVHNGGEAMTVFPEIKDMPPEEAEAARRNLLKYCELDTLALVKLWQKLNEDSTA